MLEDPKRVGRVLWRRKGWLALGLVLGLGAALAALFAAEPRYAATSRLLVAPDAVASAVPEAARGPVAAQVELLHSRPLVEAALADLGGVPAWAGAGDYEAFARRHLSVTGDPRTGIVSITVAAPDPAFAYQAANAVAAAYIHNDQRGHRLEATQAAAFIEEQVRQVSERLARAEERLRSYQARHGAIGLSQQARAIIAEVARLEAERAAGRADVLRAEKHSAGLRRRLGLPPATPGELERDPVIQRYLAQLLAAQAAGLSEARPGAGAADAEAARQVLARAVASALDARLRGARRPQDQRQFLALAEAEIDRLAAGTRVQLIGQLVPPLQARLAAASAKEIDLARLVRDVEVHADSYRALRQRLEEARIAAARLAGSARVLEYATIPSRPTSPDMAAYLGWGLLAGLALGGAAAALAERVSPLRAPGQLREYLPYPVLGVLPWLPAEQGRRGPPRSPARLQPGSQLAGQLRALRKSIRMVDVGHPVSAIVITSTTPGQGQSLAAAHLAASIAQSGLTVALVDANLYQPAQHNLFTARSEPGLTGVLSGQASLEQALVSTGVRHLHLLPGGAPPVDPGALAESRRMGEVLRALRERFDYVLVDAPSLAVAADAARLAASLDGLVLFVGLGVATSIGLQEAAAALAAARARVLGMLVRRPPPYPIPAPAAVARRAASVPSAPPPALSQLTSQASRTLAEVEDLLAELRTHP